MTDELLFRQTGETGVITFNRPEARNALTFDMYESLATLCESVLDKSLGCLLYTSPSPRDRQKSRMPSSA